jgi:hypothetical protein
LKKRFTAALARPFRSVNINFIIKVPFKATFHRLKVGVILSFHFQQITRRDDPWYVGILLAIIVFYRLEVILVLQHPLHMTTLFIEEPSLEHALSMVWNAQYTPFFYLPT